MTRSVDFLSRTARWSVPLSLLLSATLGVAAPTFTLASYPLFLAPAIQANVLIMFDNSQSMDGTMAGKVISGDDVNTRGNIARTVLRGILDNYRYSFNWGLGSFETTGNLLTDTSAYYLGDPATMVYTNDCVAGISASNGGLRCIPNPDPANGFSFLTYARSGDDADINDVLYTVVGSWAPYTHAYGVGVLGSCIDSSGTDYGMNHCYRGYFSRNNSTNWTTGDFSHPVGGGSGMMYFTPTDAGFLPTADTMERQLWVRRGWGYYGGITGMGKLNEPVALDSSAHFNALKALLGNETNSASGEIKNSATFTPLTGSLMTANDYFSKGLSASKKSPITQTCQRNFVVLATDGNPTGKTDGTQYDHTEWESTWDGSSWTFKQAQLDVFAQLTALRSITLSGPNLSNLSLAGKNFDVQTYIVGMGDTVANASSVAALNQMANLGGGSPTAFLGSDSSALQAAFEAIVGNIQAKISAASSVALNSGSWSSSAALYQAKFSSADWSGNLLSFAVAADGTLAAAPAWEAATQVKSQNWDTGRQILTYKPSASSGHHGIPFRWPALPSTPTATELDVSQSTALDTNPSAVVDGNGEWRLKFLRGDTSKEARNCMGACAPQFRNRNLTPLGDIVNSAPVYVGTPSASYFDYMEAASYRSFVTSHTAPSSRTPMIYVGANDGMLHGFDTTTGNEVFAYVPSPLYDSLNQLTSTAYGHRYYVDGSPTVGDVFYSGAWHTLLVSGMRAGAKGLFALDVTNPSGFKESNAKNIVRWEFQDPDLGYVFSQPVLMKANNGQWVVIVSNGYNAGGPNYKAALFVINAETGALIKKIYAGSGSAVSPNGLSGAAVVDVDNDRIADIVYAGDLNGALWKFDLSSNSAASWAVGNGGAALFNAGAPIVDRPNVTPFPKGGYMVVFGTGSYMSTTDAADTSSQGLYGIWDNLSNSTVTLSNLEAQAIKAEAAGADGSTYRLSTHAVGPATDNVVAGDNARSLSSYYANKRGWYLTLPTSGERSVADPLIRGGRAVFTSLIPDTSSPCAFGGSGWVMEFDVNTGNRYDSGSFDTNADGSVNAADNILFTGFGVKKSITSGRRIDAIPAAPSVIELPRVSAAAKECTEVKYQNKSDGNMSKTTEKCGTGGSARVMWREVQ